MPKNILWRVHPVTKAIEILAELNKEKAEEYPHLFGVAQHDEIPFSDLKKNIFNSTFRSSTGEWLHSKSFGGKSDGWIYGATANVDEKIWAERLRICCKELDNISALSETSEQRILLALALLSRTIDDSTVLLWRKRSDRQGDASLIAKFVPESKKIQEAVDENKFIRDVPRPSTPVWKSITAPAGVTSSWVGIFPVYKHKDSDELLEVTVGSAQESYREVEAYLEPIVIVFSQFIKMISKEKYLADTQRTIARTQSESEVLFDSSPIGIAVALDRSCERIKVNPSAARMLGVQSNEYYSKSSTFSNSHPFRVFSQGEEVRPDQLPLQRAAKGESVNEIRLDILHENGRCFNLFEYAYPLFDEIGDIRGSLGFFVDVTALQTTENRLAEQLARMRLADERKDRFIALLGHELRNPLAAISSAANLLGQPSMEAKRDWILEMLHRQVRNLGRLLDDLLDISRMEHGKLIIHRERIELSSIIHRATETIRVLFDSKQQKIVFDLPPSPIFVYADPIRLEQVIGNLLTNAGKYSDNGQTVHIHVTDDNTNAIIKIKDNGLGISEEILPYIFIPFTQALPTDERSKKGLGLGLSLVKNLVELHGGEVLVETEGLGNGSTFTVKIPLASSQNHAEETEGTRERTIGELPPLKIFVVDDNEDAARALGAFLESLGHQVTLAFSGEEAIKIGRELQFHVVFLDIGLPDMSGYRVAIELKKGILSAQIRFVATTGFGEAKDLALSLEAGFTRHLVKPINFDAVEDLLEEISSSLQSS